MNGIFWLKDIEAYAVNPGGTYATNVDLSCLHAAGFVMRLLQGGVMVSHPLCKGSILIRSGRHLLYVACFWASHNAKRGKFEALDQQVWSSMYAALPSFGEVEE